MGGCLPPPPTQPARTWMKSGMGNVAITYSHISGRIMWCSCCFLGKLILLSIFLFDGLLTWTNLSINYHITNVDGRQKNAEKIYRMQKEEKPCTTIDSRVFKFLCHTTFPIAFSENRHCYLDPLFSNRLSVPPAPSAPTLPLAILAGILKYSHLQIVLQAALGPSIKGESLISRVSVPSEAA